MERVFQPSPGSTLRFSQPLSGFRATKYHGLISCRYQFLGCLPSKLSPRKDRSPLSGPLTPLQLSTRPRKRDTSNLITSRFTDAHAVCAVAWIPSRLWVPFQRVRRPASWSPWVTNDGIAPSTSFTCSEVFFPPRIRSTKHERTRAYWPILPWVHSPLKTKPSKLRNLYPLVSLRTQTRVATRDTRDR